MPNQFCSNCPRKCLIGKAFCGKEQDKVRIAKVMRHKFEEPPICPEDKGSGAVFFSNCSLKCAFCQNFNISHFGEGKDFSLEELCQIFKKVEASGVANLNLVTPTHYIDIIIDALKICKLTIPVVWNSSGYEEKENIKKLKGLVQIFLFDFKYFDDKVAIRYSKAPKYFQKTLESIKEARKIVPIDKFKNGEMQEGIIIRHLILPSNTDDSIKIFKAIKENFGTDIYVSLMSQYIPYYNAKQFPEINRKLKPLEYKKVYNKIIDLGFNKGFIQDFDSASTEYTPEFTIDKFWDF